MKTAIIIGGGMAGVTTAHFLHKDGWKVRLFEAHNVLGGGCHTFHYGGHPYTLGPRPIYTEYEEVFNFLNQFVPMKRFKLYTRTYVAQDDMFYSYPIHEDDISIMPDRETILKELAEAPAPHADMNFEEYYIASLGPTLYEKFVNHYSKKMWGITDNTELTDFSWSLKGVALKKGARNVRDDLIHAHPSNMDGYNPYFESIVDKVEVNLNTKITRFDPERRRIKADGIWIQGDILVSSTSLDLLMNYAFGELRYIGRKFIPIVLPCEQIIPDPTLYLYYGGQEHYTRIVEYKKLYGYNSPFTLIGVEIPSFKNKLYPYPIKSEEEKAKQYLDNLPEGVYSIGRLGRYKYDNIGQVYMQARELAKNLK